MDGMWVGIPPKYESTDYDAAAVGALGDGGSFTCPQQPHLKLPLSRVNDGICDCCDGSDESSSSSSTTAASSTSACPDICNQVLAEERAASAKAQSDFTIGSSIRSASIRQYNKWFEETSIKLNKLKQYDLVNVNKEKYLVEEQLKHEKLIMARNWLHVIQNYFLTTDTLVEIVDGTNSAEDSASFIISLCWLSAETSSEQMANDRCVALDRASLDLGMLWNYSTAAAASDDNNSSASLPSFVSLDVEDKFAVIKYAEKILLRLEGKDTQRSMDHSASKTRNDQQNHKKSKYDHHDAEEEEDHEDSPYGDDYEDHHDYGYDDDYVGHEYEEEDDSTQDEIEQEGVDVSTEEEKKEPTLSPTERMVKSLLDSIPIDRKLFKEQTKLLLKYSVETASDDEGEGEADGDLPTEGEAEEAGNNEAEEEEESSSNGIDPMANQMVKSAINKRLSNIFRGEKAAKSAARFIASVIDQNDGPSLLGEVKKLAIMTLYHSKVATGDVAELIYSTSSVLRRNEGESSQGDESCAAPWATMCPPRKVSLGENSYPPSVIVIAAQKQCIQRENSVGVCAAQAEDEIEFPNTLSDGYYNYYEPQSRGPEDILAPSFTVLDSLHQMPQSIVDKKKESDGIERKRNSLAKQVKDLESELGVKDESPKFGNDGELYIMRDVCYTVESGKYEYEVCIFGKAAQRDIGQKSGGTNLGSWEALETDDDGQTTLKWGGGTKCWNGPVRSADVTVTCGAETKLLTADEPETCKYAFTMESPLGCDDKFKVKNAL